MNKSKKSLIIWCCVAVVLLIFLGGSCSTYNTMATGSELVDKAWADVQSQYQRRLDLIPNLINTVKGATEYEKSTLADVTKMRTAEKELEAAQKDASSKFSGPDGDNTVDPQKYAELERKLSVYVNAVHEAYPELSATQNFRDLSAELAGTENRISTARNRYNETVTNYNISLVKFPNNIFAGLFGFNKKQTFQAEAGAEKAPQVDFSK